METTRFSTISRWSTRRKAKDLLRSDAWNSIYFPGRFSGEGKSWIPVHIKKCIGAKCARLNPNYGFTILNGVECGLVGNLWMMFVLFHFLLYAYVKFGALIKRSPFSNRKGWKLCSILSIHVYYIKWEVYLKNKKVFLIGFFSVYFLIL